MSRLLAEDPELTGLVVHNEAAVERGAGRAALRLGRRVPEDVSVVAICPDELAERPPGLTSVLVPAEDVGTHAVTLLMRKLGDGERAGGDPAGAPVDGAGEYRSTDDHR